MNGGVAIQIDYVSFCSNLLSNWYWLSLTRIASYYDSGILKSEIYFDIL